MEVFNLKMTSSVSLKDFPIKLSTCVVFLCVFMILLTGVKSEIDTTEQSTPQNGQSGTIDWEFLESVENIRGYFVGVLEAAVNKTLSEADFINSLFPEIEEVDAQDEDSDPIKDDLKKLSVKARELGSELDKNKDGQITLDEVQPLDAERKKKVDEILKVIVEIQRNIDGHYDDQDGELFDEDIHHEVAEDPDLIDLDDDAYDFHDEL